MVELDLTALFTIDPAHGLRPDEFTAQEKNLEPFLQKIATRQQGFYSDAVLHDDEAVTAIERTAHDLQGRYEDIVVLGIGGSALGARALQEALTNAAESKSHLHVLDNIDPSLIAEVEARLDLKKTLFLVVTKSGETPEMLAQYFYFLQKIEAAKIPAEKAFIFITGPKGFLAEEARQKNIIHFPVPENVGGRFSVLTAVGLLPAAFLAIDIRKLLKGAQGMRDRFLSKNFQENIAFQLATVQYLLYHQKKTINVFMPYAQKLFRLADWYRQLLAESIGKAKNNLGEEVHVGITPINALGVTDQHSQLQLYMEGPLDKLLIFLEVENFDADQKIPISSSLSHLAYLQNVSFAELVKTEKKATADALSAKNRPHLTLKISQIDAENLGALFLFFEGATAFLGEYFEINAFDQPGVELSKTLTKKFLSS